MSLQEMRGKIFVIMGTNYLSSRNFIEKSDFKVAWDDFKWVKNQMGN